MKQTIVLVSVLFSLMSCTTEPVKLTGKDLQKDQILFFLNNYENGLKPKETTLSNLTEYDNEAYKKNNEITITQDAYAITRTYLEKNTKIMVCELHIEAAKTLDSSNPTFLSKEECIELIEDKLRNIERLPASAFPDPSGKTFGWQLEETVRIEMVVEEQAIHFALH